MRKPNMLRSHLYRILVCLSVITLLAGQAAAPADDPTPVPSAPTPAQQAWADWTAREPTTAHSRSTSQFGTTDDPGSPNLTTATDYCPSYPKYNYTAAVFSAASNSTNWDREIYIYSPLCNAGIQTRLTSSPGADIEPQLSRDKRLIAFVTDRHSTNTQTITNIYTMSINGKNLQRITTTFAQDRMPSFSPDGTKIVFVSTRDGNPEIYVMNSDGTNQVRLTRSPEVDVEPDWSPDGKQIAWVRRTSGTDLGTIYTMNPDGTGVKAIVSNKPFIGQPRWSPSGTRLLLRYSPDPYSYGWYRLAIVNSDGSDLHAYYPAVVSNSTTDYAVGGWLPDERGIVFSATEYVEYEEEWYILKSGIYKNIFGDLSTPLEITLEDQYGFTPHLVSYENVPPISTLAPLPEYSLAQNVKLNWSISDDYSGVKRYEISYKTEADPAWKSVTVAQPTPESPKQGTFDFMEYVTGKVYFRIQAFDHAGNVEPLPPYDAWTNIYQSKAQVIVLDAREQPMRDITGAVTPQPLNNPVTGLDGKALYYMPLAVEYKASFNKPGYASPPIQKWDMMKDQVNTAVLTGLDEQIENRDFEAPTSLERWQTSGMYIHQVWWGRFGSNAAQLGKTTGDMFSLNTPIPLPDAAVLPQAVAYDNQDRLHILYNDNHYGILGLDGVIEPWPALPIMNARREINFDFSGQPYLTTPTQVIRWNGSEWVTVTVPIPDGTTGEYAIDAEGRIRAIYNNPAAMKVQYIRQAANGTWQAPIMVKNYPTPEIAIALEPDGTTHLAATNNRLNYMKILPDGVTFKTGELDYYVSDNRISLEYVPARGMYLIVIGESGWSASQFQDGSFSQKMTGMGEFASFQYDEEKNIYGLSINRPKFNPFNDVKLQVLPVTGPQRTYSFREVVNGSLFEVTAEGTPFLIHGSDETGSGPYYYRTAVFDQLSEITEISQPISLDAGMHAATVSFFYKSTSLNAVTQSTVDIVFTPDGGEPATLFSTPANTTDWTHAWADISPYQGQTGTLSIQVVQAAGEMPVYALIDEISVASLPTPILQSINPSAATYPVPTDTWVDLNGLNIWNGAVISIDGTQVAQVEYIDETHIRFLAPDALSLGAHVVKAANPGGGEGCIILTVGTPVFVPVIRR